MPDDHPALLTVDQLARELSVTRRTIYNWMEQGKIPSYKIGGSRRFRLEEVYQVFQQFLVEASPRLDEDPGSQDSLRLVIEGVYLDVNEVRKVTGELDDETLDTIIQMLATDLTCIREFDEGKKASTEE